MLKSTQSTPPFLLGYSLEKTSKQTCLKLRALYPLSKQVSLDKLRGIIMGLALTHAEQCEGQWENLLVCWKGICNGLHDKNKTTPKHQGYKYLSKSEWLNKWIMINYIMIIVVEISTYVWSISYLNPPVIPRSACCSNTRDHPGRDKWRGAAMSWVFGNLVTS